MKTIEMFQILEEVRGGVAGLMAASDQWDGAREGNLTGDKADAWEFLRKADADLSSVASSLEAVFRAEVKADQENPPTIQERINRLFT